MRPPARGASFAGLVLSVSLLAFPRAAAAVELWSDEGGERTVELETALKWSSLLSYAPDDPVLFPERYGAANLLRLRLGLEASPFEWMDGEVAYEHRTRSTSGAAGGLGAFGALPSDANAPYRIAQLDWPIAEIDGAYSYRHEIDRALVAFHLPFGELTLGRQAVGWGRGVLFGAVDVFSPFSPLEVDREWRRGVDAARVDFSLSDTLSLDVVAAFGDEWKWSDSALLGRLRGYVGDIDGEIICGKRAEDMMYAATVSAAVGDAELHCEFAVFDAGVLDVPEEAPDGGCFGNVHLVRKIVFGGSYNFDVGNGLTVFIEYHYSGFGVDSIEEALTRMADPDFLARLMRGDLQIIGRHAVALQASYPLTDALSAGLMWMGSPADGSGLVAPTISWDFADNVTLVASAFFPHGAAPEAGTPQSEYGGTPRSGFLQVRLYY